MLKAEMKERLDELEPQLEEYEEQIEELNASNAEMAGAIEELTRERDELTEQLETAQATLDSVREIPDSDDLPAVRDWLVQLLIDLKSAQGVHDVTKRALTGAIDSIAIALRGRWPDENDPDEARVDRVREVLDRG